jgi:two-component system, LytTR family, sensor kinase
MRRMTLDDRKRVDGSETEVVNDRPSATNGAACNERPYLAGERPLPLSPAGRGEAPVSSSSVLLRRTAVLLILLFFATQFSTMTLSRFVRVPDESWDVILPRLIVTVCGVLFSLLNLRIQRRVGRATLQKRIWVAAGMAVAGAYFHAAANLAVFGVFVGFGNSSLLQYLGSYSLFGLDWLWFYSALSVMILALTYAADLAESEDRVAALQSQAHAAQLKALRYQLNPHFLFNTLNSVAALINSKRRAEAETMVESLSDFLRSTLAMDAGNEIPLGQEIELQSLYLDIEKARFPARLNVVIDVPDPLRDALVPNLITQPLVENAIKYGVARSSERVNLGIVARETDGKLSLLVWDDGGNAAAPAQQEGTKVGLRNVSERLTLHFGPAATLTAGPRAGGGFLAEILMPLKRA